MMFSAYLFSYSCYFSFVRTIYYLMQFTDFLQGLRNDFQEALEKVDQAFLDEILASQVQDADGRSSNDVKVQDDGITYDEIQKMAANLGKGDRDLDMKVITHFIQVKMM